MGLHLYTCSKPANMSKGLLLVVTGRASESFFP